MSRRALLLLGFALLVVATGWLSRQSGSPSDEEREAAAHLPDYYMHGMQARISDENGATSHRLVADSLYHYPEGDRSELSRPDITVYTQKSSTWHATAENGVLSGVNDELRLNGDIRMTQQGESVMSLRTERLNIDTVRRYAETDAAVTLEGEATQIEGIGMQAYGDEERLILLSQVRGRYATE